ncbi:MAG: hypothetical protein WBV82_02405 [Myxococcaceae bacterium]
MLPESANSTFCVMSSWSQSSTAPSHASTSASSAAGGRNRWHMTQLADQPVARVVYNGQARR